MSNTRSSHGSISKKKKSAVYNYTINNLDGLIIIAHLFNGKMRGPKYNQFVLLISYLKIKCTNFDFTILPTDTSYLGENS